MKNGNTKVKIAYISGPYTALDDEQIQTNILVAYDTALQVAEKGYFPLCPHKNTEKFDKFCSQPYEFYIDGDLELIRRIKPDAMVMCGDFTSSEGAMKEMELAIEMDIPIYEHVTGLPDLSKIDELYDALGDADARWAN